MWSTRASCSRSTRCARGCRLSIPIGSIVLLGNARGHRRIACVVDRSSLVHRQKGLKWPKCKVTCKVVESVFKMGGRFRSFESCRDTWNMQKIAKIAFMVLITIIIKILLSRYQAVIGAFFACFGHKINHLFDLRLGLFSPFRLAVGL